LLISSQLTPCFLLTAFCFAIPGRYMMNLAAVPPALVQTFPLTLGPAMGVSPPEVLVPSFYEKSFASQEVPTRSPPSHHLPLSLTYTAFDIYPPFQRRLRPPERFKCSSNALIWNPSPHCCPSQKMFQEAPAQLVFNHF